MNVLRASFIYSIFKSISRAFGFVRDIFIANVLGTGLMADIFFVAFRLPNTFRRIFSEGALNSAFVPIYTKLIKDSSVKIKSEIIEQLWKILISDNNVDLYESNLMRRICGLIYFSDKESGEIKMRLIKSK